MNYIVKDIHHKDRIITARDINEVRKRMYREVKDTNTVFIDDYRGNPIGEMYKRKDSGPVLWTSGRIHHESVVNPVNGRIVMKTAKKTAPRRR